MLPITLVLDVWNQTSGDQASDISHPGYLSKSFQSLESGFPSRGEVLTAEEAKVEPEEVRGPNPSVDLRDSGAEMLGQDSKRPGDSWVGSRAG